MSSSAARKTVVFSIPENIDFDPVEIRCTLNTIASLASRCLDSGEGTVNHDLLWAIIKITERFEGDIKSVGIYYE